MIRNKRFSYCGLLMRVLLFSLCTASSLFAQSASPLNDPRIEPRVDALLKQMTLEEKVNQLVQLSADPVPDEVARRGGWEGVAARGEVGSLMNVTEPARVNAIQKAAVEKSRLHIPILFGLDVIHGFRTDFPVPLGMSATWDPVLVEKAARVAAQEASAAGVRWAFSPMVDIARDARWGRIVEGAGEDPYLGSLLARAYVRGYQGSNLDAPGSIAACAKHYVAYGAAEGGRDYNTVDISDRTLRGVYLPPFHAAVEAGVATLMSAFDSLNGVPASANGYTIKQILKGEWKFQGFVVSDWAAVAELIPHGIALDGETAVRKAFLAGVDMDMVDGLYANLIKLVRAGAVPESAIDDAVRRILRVKFALGLAEHPYAPEGNAPAEIPAASRELERTVAEESFVLLKNEALSAGAPALPIGLNVHRLALIGPLADDAADMLGPWATARANAQDVVTLRAALAERAATSRFKLVYAKGTEIWGDSKSGFAEAASAASQADLVVMALGEDDASSGEAGSRAHLGLPGNQQKLLEAVAATGKPIVLVLFNGHPLALTPVAAKVRALVEAWFPGTEAGPALAHVLFGDTDFSGRLTVSLPRAVGQEPLYYNAFNTGRPAEGMDLSHRPLNSDERYQSRYFDEQNSPLFPFGFGLSYTKFSYSPLTLSVARVSAAELNAEKARPLKVSAEVKNEGDRPGTEVVQLYIRQQGTSVARPVRELKGFQRVALDPGESKRVEFTLGREELKFWNLEMKDVVEPARVTVWIGPSSVAGSEVQFEVTK
jgi:beta-glucosidase